MTYKETLEYLFTRLPMYQRQGKKAYKEDLTNTVQLLGALNNPHNKFKSIHIAGTNGKGTSAHAIASILQVSNYKTGLYTSPHLKSFTERIKISGQEVSEDFVVDFVERIRPSIDKINPSFFEITVAMAFDYFAKEEVDIAVVETGLGGRLDSTNVITPEVCLITNIGYDHMDILGDTLPEIAQEKAGIIKMNVPVVVGEILPETAPIFEQMAEKNEAPLIQAGRSSWKPASLVPSYLLRNMGGVEAVIVELKRQGWGIPTANITKGAEQINKVTGLKGRFQVLEENPLVIADVSHNEGGLKVLFSQIQELNRGALHLVFGTVKDKELKPLFDLIPSGSTCYWTQSNVPRSLPVEELAIQGVMYGITGDCYKDVNEAIRMAKEKAQSNDTVLITGSTFVVAEIDEL